MPLTFFKAQATGKGSLGSIRFTSKDQSFFVEIVKQTSWNPEKKIGSFIGGAKICTKLSMNEVGGMLLAVKNKSDYKTIHKTNERTLQIGFTPYHVDNKETGEKQVYKGFGLSLFVNKDESYRIGFSPGELEILTRYLGFGLDHCFSAIYAEDKRKSEEYFKAKSDGKGVKESVVNQDDSSHSSGNETATEDF